MQIIRINHHIKGIIDSALRKNYKISLRVTPKKKTYINYDIQLNRLFNDTSNNMYMDVEMCVVDYPEDPIYLTVMSPDGIEIDHLLH